MSSTLHLVARQAAQQGSNRGGGSNSLSSIVSTLVPVLIVAVISVTLFLFLRKKYTKVYQPRSQEGILHQDGFRTPASDRGFFSVIRDFKGLPDNFILEHNSLDGYLFLRYFKILIVICFLGCCITWPILFPVNATGGAGNTQLNILNMSNVLNVNRYYAHALVAWVFLGLVCVIIARERMYFIGLRQAYFLNTLRAKRLTSRTVLFMGIPKDQQSEEGLRNVFGRDVRNIWMATDCDKLQDLVKDRDKAALKLEGAEVKLSKQAGKKRMEELKKNPNASREDTKDPNHWIDNKSRPTHRLKFLIGKKVDTINWSQKEIPKMNKDIASQQETHKKGTAPFVGAAFVEFTSQAAAQRAFQLAAKSKKKTMEPRYIDVSPEEVIWKNLKTTYAARKAKVAVMSVLVALLIIFWTPIILFIGALTNINSLTNKVHFLSFINDIPKVILGVVTGLLPTIILAVCIILVPIIMRLMAKLAGEPTLSAVELKTQSWYFAFQVVQVFIMTTFASAATSVVTKILEDPSIAPTLLATNLPLASNFYISYFILYGLAQAASQLLNIVALALNIILGKFLDSTPRKMFKRWINLAGIGWGSEYPKWTNLCVIAISYSCIAPLVLGFATVGFSLLYLMFRYKWLFVLGNQIDMKGEAYSKALQQLYVGVYLSALCLTGLFAIGVAKDTAATGPLVLMLIFLVLAIAFQVLTNYALSPLEKGLPLSLTSEDAYDYEVDDEEQQKHERPTSDNSGSDVDGYKNATTGNKLSQRFRPYIDQHFYEPNKNMNFELAEIKYSYSEAYYNPAIASDEPFIWLARDECGVSKMLVQDNKTNNISSTDEFAWFDEKNKLHWDVDRVGDVERMLDEKKTMADYEAAQEEQHDERK